MANLSNNAFYFTKCKIYVNLTFGKSGKSEYRLTIYITSIKYDTLKTILKSRTFVPSMNPCIYVVNDNDAVNGIPLIKNNVRNQVSTVCLVFVVCVSPCFSV